MVEQSTIDWEWDKIYNLADPNECYLYLKRIADILDGAKRKTTSSS